MFASTVAEFFLIRFSFFIIFLLSLVYCSWSERFGQRMLREGFQNTLACTLWAMACTVVYVVGMFSAVQSIVGVLILIWAIHPDREL